MRVGAVHCYECVQLYNHLIYSAFTKAHLESGFELYIDTTRLQVAANWAGTARLLSQQPGLPHCPHCFGTRVAVVDQEFRNRFSDELLQVKFEPDGRVFTHKLWKWSEEESRERLLELIEREEVTRAKLAKKANAPNP